MRTRLLTLLLGGLVIAAPVFAKELKIGYIHSQRIMAEFQESIEAQRTLDDEQKKWLDEAKKMEDEISKMEDELQNQSLLLSEEKKSEKMQKIQEKYLNYQKFQADVWGEQGKLYQRNKVLTQPILDKVNTLIQKLGKDGGYDVIWDAAVGNIVYAKDDYDMTQLLLDELNK
ncbi:MAG: OmpH family outer membrane protein [bacterium]|nr:OmpH family outer membrane protein [bacterium]